MILLIIGILIMVVIAASLLMDAWRLGKQAATRESNTQTNQPAK
jgi:flagellar basal body-associated protein FliL